MEYIAGPTIAPTKLQILMRMVAVYFVGRVGLSGFFMTLKDRIMLIVFMKVFRKFDKPLYKFDFHYTLRNKSKVMFIFECSKIIS